MKKKLQAMCFVTVLMLAVSSWAAPIVGPWTYTPPIDSILQYELLATASQAQEESWVATAAGYASVAAFLADFPDYYDDSVGVKQVALNAYDPAITGWTYALVKVDGPNDYTYLFRDDNSVSLASGDDLLTTPAINTLPFNMNDDGKNKNGYAISHVRFFGGTQQVPEPSVLFLIGAGLIGIGSAVRRNRKR